MAITRFGNKMLRGTKLDRVSDSLGSSADGSNDGITLVTSGEALNTAVVNFGNITAQGNWEKTGSGGALTFTNGINQESGGSGNTQMPYLDLQNSSYLGSGNYASETKWTLRWKQTWASSPDNYGTPFMVLSSTTGYQSASQNYIGIRFDGSSITAGGETSSAVDGASSSTGVSTSYTSTTYYMELVRDGSNIYVRNYTSSAYDTIAQESSAISIGSGTYNLRYIKMIPRWDSGSGDFDTTWDHIKFYNGVAFQLAQNKLGSGAYSFDGSNDYVSIDDSSANLIQGRSSAWTIAGWLKRDGSTDKYFISQWGKNSSPDNRVFHIGIDSNGKLLYRQRTDGGQGEHFTSNNAIADNTWTHFAIVWQPNGSSWQAQMYINGTADNSKTDFGNDMRGGSITEPIYLGKNGSDATAPSTGGDYFNGELDDLAVWHRVLTATEIETLVNTTSRQGYEGGFGGDASPYSGGGGGGAGGAGANGSAGVAGAGGIGKENPITGSEIGELNGGKYWLGGGGGGFGNTSSGAGGKGGGSGNNSGDNGTANTGGGAGARDGNTGAGGSGVVLVSYQTGQITDGSSDGSLETGSNIPSGYAIRKFVLTGSSTQNFNFVISSGSGNVQYVIVGGGGGGGTDSYSSARGSGGGGGGGFVTGTKSMSAGTYSVTVGRGGADATNGSNNDGGDGDNSVFDGITAYGGGGGATHYSSEIGGLWGKAGSKGTGGGGNNSSITRGSAVHNTNTGALVSSLTNKSELKAYYSMNSTSLGATAFFTPDDDYASASGWTDVDTGGDIAIDTTNKGVTYTDVNVGDSGIGKSLGKTLSNSKWLVQFTFQIADWNTNDAGLVSLTSDHTQGFKVSGLKTITFMPQGTPLGAGSGSYNRFVLMSGQTNSYAEVTSSNNALVANTQYWVDMYRDGSNVKCKVWTNANRTGTPHFESSNLAIGTNLDGLTGIQHWNENTADSDIGTGWVREVKVYDGVTATEGCKNDYSSTSNLDAMTNLPENTIFFQTDDTPHYRWLQSGVWELDAISATAFWSTANTSAIFANGATYSGNYSKTNGTMEWNGTAWSNGSNTNEASYFCGGIGNRSGAMVIGGTTADAGANSADNVSEKWDGSSWTSTNALNSSTTGSPMGGTISSGYSATTWGGGGASPTSATQSWDGTSWSASTNCATASRFGNGDGNSNTNFFIVGGTDSATDRSEIWNGSSWSAGVTFDGTGTQTGRGSAGAGSGSTNFIGFNDERTGNNYGYTFNGTAWTLIAQPSQQNGDSISVGGDSNKAITASSWNSGSSTYTNYSEYWNGSTWSTNGNLTTNKAGGGMGASA